MAIYTGSGNLTISDNINLDTGTTLGTAVGGVTVVDNIFDIPAGLTITISGAITSSTNKLIKRGAGTLAMGADQGTSMAGGYQLEEGTLAPGNSWLSTYLGDTAGRSTPTANFVPDFFDLRGGTLDFSTWNISAVQGRLFSHADQGVTLTSGTTTLITNFGNVDTELDCHVTCNGGTLNYTQSESAGDLNINGNLLGSKFIRSGNSDIRVRGTNNQLTHGIRILGGQVRLERPLGPNPTELVPDYFDFAGDFALRTYAAGDQRLPVLRLVNWEAGNAGDANGPAHFPANQGWTVNGFCAISLRNAAATAQAAYDNPNSFIHVVNGPVMFANGTEKHLHFYKPGDGGAGHIAFRGGVSGDASGDDSGIFIDDTGTYCYVHAQSDINLPNAVFSGRYNTSTVNQGSLWVKGGNRAKFRKLRGTTWLETQGTTAEGAAVIDFAEIETTTGLDKSVQRFEFNASINHIYLPQTAYLNTIANDSITGLDSATTELGGSFAWNENYANFRGVLGSTAELFVDGDVSFGHMDTASNTTPGPITFSISPTSVGKINIDSSLASTGGFNGHGRITNDITTSLRPTEDLTYFTGGDIFTADVNNLSTDLTFVQDDPNGWIGDSVTFTDTITNVAGDRDIALSSSLPTTMPMMPTTVTSSSWSQQNGNIVFILDGVIPDQSEVGNNYTFTLVRGGFTYVFTSEIIFIGTQGPNNIMTFGSTYTFTEDGNPSDESTLLSLSGNQVTFNLVDPDTQPMTIPSGGTTLMVAANTVRTISGAISGTGDITKTGPGTLRLTGGNTYTGKTIVMAGAIEIDEASALGTTNTATADAIDLRNGTRLITNHNNSRISLDPNIGIRIAGTATIESNNGTTDILGIISQDGATAANLEISTTATTGTVRLRGNNTFTGTTHVNRGATLDINDPISPFNNVMLRTSHLTVDGDVRGKGTIAGNVTFNVTGRFLPGAEISTKMLITGNLVLANGSTTYVSIGENTNDNVEVTGNVTLNGTLLLIPFSSTLQSGTRDLITYTGTRTGEFDVVVDYKDAIMNNGVDNVADADYPNVSYLTANKVTLITS